MGLLRSESPAFQIVCDSAHWQGHSEFLLDRQMHSLSSPQGEWQLQLIWCLIDQHILSCFFLFDSQSPFVAMSRASNSKPNRTHSTFEVLLQDRAANGGGHSDHFSNRPIIQSLLAQSDDLLAQFKLGLLVMCAAILFLHAQITANTLQTEFRCFCYLIPEKT